MLRLALVCLLGLSAAAQAGASTFIGGNLGAIPDGGPGNPPNYGQPRDVTFEVSNSAGTVSTVQVNFRAAHPFVGDLRVTLIAPNGKPHLLFARTGAVTETGFGSPGNLVASNLNNFRDSFATNWWTAVGTAEGDIPPTDARTVIAGGAGVTSPAAVTSMNASFAATPANGTWILRFEDGATNHVGTVTAAALTIERVGQTLTVSNASDSGTGSLRAAMLATQSGDLIEFAMPFFATSRSINLLTALPNISVPLAIRGPGAHLLTVRRDDVAGDMVIFTVNFGLPQVSLEGMTVSNGRTQKISGGAGGIDSDSALTLSGMHVTGNHGRDAGGVSLAYADGYFINTTFSGNVSTGVPSPGGVRFDGFSNRLVLSHCTVSGNRAALGGSGIESNAFGGASSLELVSTVVVDNAATGSGTAGGAGIRVVTQGTGASISMSLRNSIVAGNQPLNLRRVELTGTATITSQGFNLSDNYNSIATLPSDRIGDPRLGPLALQGGTTPTHLPLGGSPALDGGNSSGAVFDQRGLARINDHSQIANGGDGTDIGAVEMQAIFVTNTNSSGAGSLNAAIATANDNTANLDDILFDSTAFATPQMILLNAALPVIRSAVTISGPGADRLTLRRQSGSSFSVFQTDPSASIAAISGVRINNGRNFFGGGINSQASLTLANVQVDENTSTFPNGGAGLLVVGADARISGSTFNNNITDGIGGGAIYFLGDGSRKLTIVNTTVSDNSAGAEGATGAGILHLVSDGSSTLEIANSTIYNNVGNANGGIQTESSGAGNTATTILRNTIVANNFPNNFRASQFNGSASVFVSRGFNLSNRVDGAFLNHPSDRNSAFSGLALLANNGGATPTHALLETSGALDGGDSRGTGVTTDQRGRAFIRAIDFPVANAINGDGSDIGAYEAQNTPLAAPLIFRNGFEVAPP